MGVLAEQNLSLKEDMKNMVEDVAAKIKERTERHLSGFEIHYPEGMVKRFKTMSYIPLAEMHTVMGKGATALPSTRDVVLQEGVKLTVEERDARKRRGYSTLGICKRP